MYPSNSYVSHFDKTVSEMCLQCNVKCDICHMFFLCDNVKPFWTNFEHWYSSHIKTIKLDLITVIFGELVPNSHLLNFCLLYAKWYLHRGYKLCDNKKPYVPSFLQFIVYLKSTVTIEKFIAERNDKVEYFDDVFSILEDIL